MPIIILNGGSSGGGGSVAWADVTGKPTILTEVSDPGSDAALPTEQAVRESLDVVAKGGIGFGASAPSDLAYVITDDSPIAGTITKCTYKSRSGTITANIRINGVSVTGLDALSITSSRTSTAATAANTLAEGDVIDVVFSSGTAPVDISLTIWVTKTI